MPTPLPVFKIISTAFVFLWVKKIRFIRALLIPATVLLLIELLKYFASDFSDHLKGLSLALIVLLGLIVKLIPLAAYVLFAISCHRLVLIGSKGVPEYGMSSWTRRELWFLAYLILLPLVYYFSVALYMIADGILLEFDVKLEDLQILFAKGDGLILVILLVALPSAYLFSRFSLLYPATAVDRDVDVPWAWSLTKNNGWRLMVIIVFLPLLFILLRIPLLMVDNTLVVDLIDLLFSLILLAIEIVALSLSYKHLTENEPIEAKEEGVTT